MPWSDSEDESYPHESSNILLGIPDGQIDHQSDLIDAAVSRIGGLPALLPFIEPSLESSFCKSCLHPMELLVQLWCPFENSPMDRALYVWGCARAGCQGNEGSVRVWRGLRHNEAYAAKLKRKKEKEKRDQLERDASILASQKQKASAAKSNPFTMTGNTPHCNNDVFLVTNNPFSFGAHSSIPSIDPRSGTDADEDPILYEDEIKTNAEAGDKDLDTESLESNLITALASTTISDSVWKSAPAYPPLYLSTVTEYLPPQVTPKWPKGLKKEDFDESDSKDIWAKEKYENSLNVDQVFERFTQRVGFEGQQCIRYELGGSPIPFLSDKVFDLLWPKHTADTTQRVFKTNVPSCPSCHGARIFECQLMPNLINVLHPFWEEKMEGKKMTDEERRQKVQKILKKNGSKDEKRRMEWGTCLIFCCEKDCCLDDGREVNECWREELVYIQWDS